MPSFDYSFANVQELERILSRERLTPYLLQVGGDLERAIGLYEQNTALSEALYGVLQGLEISLRNAIHQRLTSATGTELWWTAIVLGVDQQGMIKRAGDALAREGKPVAGGRMVAELSFGFWTGLFGPRYADLWKDHLVKVFPRRPLQRSEVQNRLNSIRKLRNRVAHHEPILNRALQKDVNQIFDTLSWMSSVSARWVRSRSSFDERYSAYRVLFPAIPTRRP